MNKTILLLSTVLAVLSASQVYASRPTVSVAVTPAQVYTKAFSIPENFRMYKATFLNVDNRWPLES